MNKETRGAAEERPSYKNTLNLLQTSCPPEHRRPGPCPRRRTLQVDAAAAVDYALVAHHAADRVGAVGALQLALDRGVSYVPLEEQRLHEKGAPQARKGDR